MAAKRKPVHAIINSKIDPNKYPAESEEMALLLQNKEALVNYINKNVLGTMIPLPTPFGTRPLVYADYTASGRSLDFLEKYITEVILKNYANTHTSTSWVGLQSGFFREEARSIIHRCVGASEEDALIFSGSGSTSAINKLVQILRLSNWGQISCSYKKDRWGSIECLVCSMNFSTQGRFLEHLETPTHEANIAYKTSEDFDNKLKPIVFLSVFEHHSNLLPWREVGATTVTIHENQEGELDLEELRQQLEFFKEYPIKIGSFSACSNLTGIITDVESIARLLHQYEALAFFDFAGGAPYMKINMNPSKEASFDGLFLSPHKFVGGPGTPGVLVVKKKLLGNEIPVMPGGGTVFFVTETDHNYILSQEEREEGGTPDIIGSIRAGLVFQLKEAIGQDLIDEKEAYFSSLVMERLRRNPNIAILGDSNAKRIPIFSFLIKCGSKYFHYSFIAALFNDLFGIEVRGGCACAGPYALQLMGIDVELSYKLRDAIARGFDLFRPGMIRFNINYFCDDKVLNYILDATDFIANNALWFLPEYKFDMERSSFLHRRFSTREGRHKIRKWLGEISYATGEMTYPEYETVPIDDLNEYFAEAEQILNEIKTEMYCKHKVTDNVLEIPEDLESIRWFVLPSEMLNYIHGNTDQLATTGPFSVRIYNGKEEFKHHIPEIPTPLKMVKKTKKEPKLWPRIPKKLLKKTIEAVHEFDMIREGDRILVCISGGKDSLTMLHVLKHIERVSRKQFEIGAATVDPQVPEYDPSPLKEYMAKLEVPYFYEQFPIVELAATKLTKKVSLCAFCSRMKRGILYSCARRENYNVLALGQHLDDLGESFIMSIFNNGLLRTMKAHYTIEDGDLRVIRPLSFVRERQTKEFADDGELPVIFENCPACFAAPTERHRTKLLLASQEQIIPDIFSSLQNAMKPLMGGEIEAMKNENKEKKFKTEEPEEDCLECLLDPN